MTDLWHSLFRLSASVAENSLQMMDSAIGALQSAAGGLSGQPALRPSILPPFEGPPDIDTATAEFSTRLARIAMGVSLRPNALLDASFDAFDAARKCFSYVEKDPRAWMMLPIQLPL
jgi:hypothetical protein